MDFPSKQTEIEAQIAELSQRYNEAQRFVQQTGDRIIYLQGQLALLAEMQKAEKGSNDRTPE